LEDRVIIDLLTLNGVVDVFVRRDGSVLNVHVVLDDLEFSKFEKVIQKELELTEKFPHLRFRFNVSPKLEAAPWVHALLPTSEMGHA
jgi:hypothetical protein